jgi:hypothetical protein
VSKSDKARREITIALIGIGVICIVAVLVVAALPYLSGPQVAQATPTNQELFDVVYHNARAANNEDIEDYMSTMHPGNSAGFLNRAGMDLIFSQYDLNFYYYDLSVISASADEASLHYALQTTKVNGPDFGNNIVTGTMVLRRDNGQWKIYSADIETTAPCC